MKSNVFVCSVDVEMLTPALKIWRNAVVTSESASQLSMCLLMLFDCVAWEKSIMKVVRMSWCRKHFMTTSRCCNNIYLYSSNVSLWEEHLPNG